MDARQNLLIKHEVDEKFFGIWSLIFLLSGVTIKLPQKRLYYGSFKDGILLEYPTYLALLNMFASILLVYSIKKISLKGTLLWVLITLWSIYTFQFPTILELASGVQRMKYTNARFCLVISVFFLQVLKVLLCIRVVNWSISTYWSKQKTPISTVNDEKKCN